MEIETNGQPRNSRAAIVTPILLALALVAGIFLGSMITSHGIGKPALFGSHETNRVDEVLNYIDAKYVDSVDRKKLTDEMIVDVLAKLDPHSYYIPGDEKEDVEEQIEGKFQGIGIEFDIVKDTIMVISTITGGPSEKLGIETGDKIVMINDTLVAGKDIPNQDVVKKLKGPKGTKVKISIKRDGNKKLLDFNIVRDEVKIYGVDVAYMVDHEIGYVKINRFSDGIYKEFMQAMEKLQNQGMSKLIVDLRGNPGGLLEEATYIADEFLDNDKLIVYTKGRTVRRKDYTANKPGVFEKGQLVVLIDQYSASASEILAGAIQDWDRGKIIGRRSFGKGLVQQEFSLKDGSVLRLTIAKYYTPTGRCIQKPYTGDIESYDEEVSNRYDKGEFYKVDSSKMVDSLKFTTPGGKVVYGGGGIMPDIFVPLDTTVNMALTGTVRALAPEFSYNYFSNHKAEFEKYKTVDDFISDYQVSDEMLNQFYSLVQQEGFKLSEENLKKIDSISRETIKAYFARQLWKNDGFYPIINDMDEVFKRAVDELKK